MPSAPPTRTAPGSGRIPTRPPRRRWCCSSSATAAPCAARPAPVPAGPPPCCRCWKPWRRSSPRRRGAPKQRLKYQQFSTPLPLAYAALQAAAMIRPGDIVLEPSAGTGMLAVMAQLALGNGTVNALHLNEIAAVRAGLLAGLFPGSAVTRHNAESIRDRLPELQAHRGADEPALLGQPRRRPHPPSRRSAPHKVGRLDAAAGRTAGGDLVRALRPRRCRMARRLRLARPAGTRGIHRAHRRPRLCAARHHLRHPPHRPRQGRTTSLRGSMPAIPVRDARQLLQTSSPRTVPARRPIEPVPGADLFGQAPSPRPTRDQTHQDRRSSDQSRRPTTGALSRSSPTRRCLPAAVPPRAPNPPVPTRGGGHRASTCPARSSTRRRWCNPAPWRRCRTPCRPTARCCRRRWWPRGSCPTPSSRASSSPARPTRSTSPPSTASEPAGRRWCASTPKAMTTAMNPLQLRKTTARPSTPTNRSPIRSASGGAGCWATAPAAARADRSPPSSSTNGSGDASARSGSHSPTSCWRTRAATGAPSAGALTT